MSIAFGFMFPVELSSLRADRLRLLQNVSKNILNLVCGAGSSEQFMMHHHHDVELYLD